jgi:hypothetical protein
LDLIQDFVDTFPFQPFRHHGLTTSRPVDASPGHRLSSSVDDVSSTGGERSIGPG